ncbi:kinesin-like protein KIF21A isoform X2 [Tetranychus urticae]|uniref:kinesin-like protein KIF21A isoform X2 n=1 Tax=Tetranychus urticae TaxID=32264 RepID=UPI00077BCF61|nr:kinesin-like protein KIF21A isoform X2 [Tetranychus urticae]
MEAETSVKVCVRIRPQVPKEIIEMCKVCTNVTPNEPQVWLGSTKAFTFDHVFNMDSKQEEIYTNCVYSLIEGCLDGYNATVLAYGQTGSGKTFTMGTGFDVRVEKSENKGIIPRAVDHLFRGIREKQQKAKEMGIPPPEFKVNVQFLELYNEHIIDLLADDSGTNINQIKIHEDASGGIYTVNTCARSVSSVESTLDCLKKGSLSRTTASTNMNSQSSRSHAIFTLYIKQQRIVSLDDHLKLGVSSDGTMPSHEFETLTAKFHFVDLAGSERLKRTGATGDRAKEAVSINAGLLALGNVISALGDKRKQGCHVPYRDSKLTRLLQDSLGGNSQTLMIACISPSDRDFMETLNTLRYANRAKNIKNKVVANQDKASETINLLRKEIQQLQLELMEYKQGKRIIGEDGNEQINDMYHENTMLQKEIGNLKLRVKALQDTNERLIARNTELTLEKATGGWITNDGEPSDLKDMVQNYLREIEELRTKLIEMEETCSQLRKQAQRSTMSRMSMSPFSSTAVAVVGNYDVAEETETCDTILKEAKKEIAKQKKISRNLSKSYKDIDTICETNGNRNIDGDIERTTSGGTNPSPINGESDSGWGGGGTDGATDGGTDGGEDDEGGNGASSSPASDESDASDEESDTEFQLAELSNEISVKEKLIIELEKSQRKMMSMKHHYEEKLLQLQAKINEIESERDRVLAKLTNVGSGGNDKAKKVRDDYQQKLNALQTEMKKLKMAEKEHATAMKSQSKYELQLRSLKNEVSEMKKQKVGLLKKMKEEAQRHKEAESRQNKKLSQLAKQERLKDVKIRNLETEANRVKSLLKRKEDQVMAMKKMIKPMSDKVAGRVKSSSRMRKGSEKSSVVRSPKVIKQKWQSIEQDINKVMIYKKNIAIHELQMERFLAQRRRLVREREDTKAKLSESRRAGKSEDIIAELLEELGNIEDNILYLNQNIDECQSTIMQLEETAGDTPTLEMNTLLADVGLEEMKYLFEKVLTMAINQSLLAVQKEEEAHEYEMKYNQLEDSSVAQENLLNLLLDTTFIEDTKRPPTANSNNNNNNNNINNNAFEAPINGNSNNETIDKLGTSNTHEKYHNGDTVGPLMGPSSSSSGNNVNENGSGRPEKARRLTKTPQELLFEQSRNSINMADDPMTQSLVNPISTLAKNNSDLHRVPSAPSLNETNETTPPSSPQIYRRNKEENVFSRLTSGTISNGQNNPDRGIMVPCTNRSYDKYSPLILSSTAEGHSRPVLSVSLTDDVMFSGSKDCTVKIWDLHTGREIQSLEDHPDSVVKVVYNEYIRLAFSVSKSIIKVWDTRENPARCIKILNSLGLADGLVASAARPNELGQNENRILDIQLNKYGTVLFSTSGHTVRVWDLRKYYCIGKLNTSHQANVICMAVEESGNDSNIVATGSKDHYIKLFEVMEDIGGIHQPICTLDPPHYDGIEALTLSGDLLFSASRDACIKKWDLTLPHKKLVQSINQAHKDWIQALAIKKGGSTLISGCRSGFVKLWSTDTCQPLGELRAHSSAIHAVDVNSKLVATGSADNNIGLFRWRSSADPSPDLCDYEP